MLPVFVAKHTPSVSRVDPTEIDSYPGAIFKQPGKSPGEPLDGFAAIDPLTGKVLEVRVC
jgi:hypothetical protein